MNMATIDEIKEDKLSSEQLATFLKPIELVLKQEKPETRPFTYLDAVAREGCYIGFRRPR
jgi:hypothetical protein